MAYKTIANPISNISRYTIHASLEIKAGISDEFYILSGKIAFLSDILTGKVQM